MNLSKTTEKATELDKYIMKILILHIKQGATEFGI